ncbi:MAG: polyribonucleotide nucleotidyltransferase, partial [Candidatus Magasanikbacteria bacterium]
MENKKWSMEWGGRTLSVETGKLALQANASCLVQYGETVIMATATMSSKTRDGLDFFPLMVNFEEKLYAAGKIKGSRFIKREGRPTEEATLSGRLVDRSIRPLFDESMRNDTQVILTALSYDGENDSQITALVAACMVLSISSIPWKGNIAGLRIGRLDGAWKINPTLKERALSDVDIVVAGNPEGVIMVEAGCKECTDDQVVEAIEFGAKQLQPVLDFIAKITKEVGLPKQDIHNNLNEKETALRAVEKDVDAFIAEKSQDWIFGTPKKNRQERVALIDKFSEAIAEMLKAKEVAED